MITQVDQGSITSELNLENLPRHWNGYFSFRNQAPELHEITNNLLQEAIEVAKNEERPFIDSQQVIGGILTDLGDRHNFHRQFNERFSELNAHQILGMQLYSIMVTDRSTWVYHPLQHEGHQFPHSTYFIPGIQ